MPPKQLKTQNQKEAVKLEICRHFRRLVQKAGGDATKVPPLSALELRNIVVPIVKQSISVSYSFTPKLIYKWATETSQEHFDGNITVTYSNQHYQVKKKKKKSVKEESDSETQSPSTSSSQQHSTVGGSPNRIVAAPDTSLGQQHSRVLLLNQQLLRQVKEMSEAFSEERLHLLAQISNQNAERMDLIQTISQLTRENAQLRGVLGQRRTMPGTDSQNLNTRVHSNFPAVTIPSDNHSSTAANFPLNNTDGTSTGPPSKKRKRSWPLDSDKNAQASTVKNPTTPATSTHTQQQQSYGNDYHNPTSVVPSNFCHLIEYVSPTAGLINQQFVVHLKVSHFNPHDSWIACVQSRRSLQQSGYNSVRQIPIQHANDNGVVALPLGVYQEACVLSIKLYNETRRSETNVQNIFIHDANSLQSELAVLEKKAAEENQQRRSSGAGGQGSAGTDSVCGNNTPLHREAQQQNWDMMESDDQKDCFPNFEQPKGISGQRKLFVQLVDSEGDNSNHLNDQDSTTEEEDTYLQLLT